MKNSKQIKANKYVTGITVLNKFIIPHSTMIYEHDNMFILLSGICNHVFDWSLNGLRSQKDVSNIDAKIFLQGCV